MSKKTLILMSILLLIVLFILAPLMLPGDENQYAEGDSDEIEYFEDDDDIDIIKKYKKTGSKSARSVGGSKSFRSGK